MLIYTGESPKASDYITMGLAPAILGQLTAIASTMITPSTVEEVKSSSIQSMDCTASLEPLTSSSLDLPLPSGICQEQVQLPQASAELLAQMPAKSVIQDDIRSGNGRFQLVRKRGRSEVWNLFGQVLDTLTNVRLPYVACYACKILTRRIDQCYDPPVCHIFWPRATVTHHCEEKEEDAPGAQNLRDQSRFRDPSVRFGIGSD
ncbi:hypothetical protein NECAME_13562 [Necator americanus]|uniref:BED-type domain-containing protein n=1 Tax=Necator americanus TaxID=51031 RepID=W2SX95_NECAM|nr:hypothetical protein NECAME_13562 [Necator americanus]ETN73267.1 hypothetical protein NECAME_13562 [Necator americanus]